MNGVEILKGYKVGDDYDIFEFTRRHYDIFEFTRPHHLTQSYLYNFFFLPDCLVLLFASSRLSAGTSNVVKERDV
jgi:hypothetical protein